MNRLALAFALITPLATQLVRAQQPNWVTVDNFSLVNQTQATGTPIAIYSPPTPGLYRISYYIEAVATTLTTPATDFVCSTFSYTDDSGQLQYRNGPNGTCAITSLGGNGAASFAGTSDIFVFRSKAMPISITVADESGLGGVFTTYNITGTIEHLTNNTQTTIG
jgi:hypothetical protein